MGVVFSKDQWIQQGNVKVLIRVTAEQNGDTITWTARPTAAQTLAYKQSHKDYVSHTTYYTYHTYGADPVYCRLRINGEDYYNAQVVGNVASTQVSGAGWISWGYSNHRSTTTVAAPWTNYTVKIVISGAGSTKQVITVVNASTTPTPPPPPEPEFLAGAQVKVSGVWKNITDGYVKVNGEWKQIVAGYVKVNGEWKSLT